jgi:nucleotide-binding universal stress UspA family protein
VPRFVAAGAMTATPYLVMEWIGGIPLSVLAKSAPLAIDEVARIGALVADALVDLHRQGAIHHDLKPDNIILTPDGRAVLIDFGFARHASYPDLLAEEMRYAAGSAPYVSPEQVSGVRNDARSDLFALGAVIYQLATGKLPFGVPETSAQLRNRLWLVPDPPRTLNAAVPPWLQEIILRCLEPDAVVRYQSAAHIAFDLRHPEQVLLTPRAERRERAGFMTQAQLWWRARQSKEPGTVAASTPSNESAIIMVAIDTSNPDDPRHLALQWTARQMAALSIDFRMICVSVIRRGFEGGQSASGAQLEHKARLHHWIAPLKLATQQVSLHVIEDDDAAGTLLAFASRNHVDLIVLGAPGPNEVKLGWWRSVASSVTANAACSVHVVRVPERPRREWHDYARPADD